MVISGKGEKDRMIPLLPDIANKLNNYIRDKKSDDSVFGLTGPSIGNKIYIFAKKAGLEDIHTHSLRHKYATDLLESGANIRAVQQLMGHSNLTTTQGYLAITDQGLHDAVSKLGKKIKQVPGDVIRPNNPYQANTEISLEPPLADPRKPFTEEFSVASFTLELESTNILIESLQVRTSEPQVPFRLMLFESTPGKTAGDIEYENLIKMEPVTQRLLNYPSGKALLYSN